MKSVFVILSAVILLQGISGYSTHEYKRYVAKNVNGYATVEGEVTKDGVTKKFYKVIPEYSSESKPGDHEFVFPDPIKIPEIKMPEFPRFQEPTFPTPVWNPFSVNNGKLMQDIFEQNKKIHESINSNIFNSFSNQPGFGNIFASQPTFGNFASQPIFGNSFSAQPSFNTFSQPAFVNTYNYPGFNTFSAQPDFVDSFPQFTFENAGNSFYYPEYPQLNFWLKK